MPEQSETAEAQPSRTAFYAMLAIAVVWLSALGILSQRSEPPVVNQRQIRRADCVVIGVPKDVAKKRVEIREVVVGKKFEEAVIAVQNLDKVQVVGGQEYVIALWDDGRIVKVSNPAKKGSGRPVAYPNTADVRHQVQQALARGRIRE